MINIHEKYMKKAIKCAKVAFDDGETPVGAVIVKDGKVISCGRNKREKKKNALCHAEIMAINKACKKLGGWRLIGCDMYVTLEPCPMCAGAIINSRIQNVYFGASDSKAGCFGSVQDFSQLPFNHKPCVTRDVLKDECSNLLCDFFAKLRQDKKRNKE